MSEVISRKRWPIAAASALIAVTGWFADAARISEPPTVLYGRISERVGGFEFPITQGRLVWNLRTTGPGGRDCQLTAQLESAGRGVFSYRLTIPHEALAYDLSVSSKAVGLNSAGAQVQHLSVTLDGQPLTVAPGAVEGFSVNPTRRAGLQRVDLYLSGRSPDSDQDGLPDWWEDQNGFDKWDPTDAAGVIGKPPAGVDPGSSPHIQTFADWRAAWFPVDRTDLELFGQADNDADGISNFLEYAFDLNPTLSDATTAGALPIPVSHEGKWGVAFRKRAQAVDLSYQVESSDDLLTWTDAADKVEPITTGRGDASAAFVERTAADSNPSRFFRVRVTRP